ncbi:MAG: hypothetical protein RLZZ568_412 [Cyanobacteriota bacterium]
MPFSADALRDAYAIRAAKLGISPVIAAKWMGQFISVHYKNYLRHIEQIDFDAVWQGLRKSEGREFKNPESQAEDGI